MRYILSLISLISLFSYAQQDSIVLLNGKVYRGTILSVEKGILTYSGTLKSETSTFEITTDRLFSYVQSGKETVLYVQNEFVGDFLTVEEARRSTLGSYDARQTFKPRFVFFSSLALGLGVSIYDTYYSQKSYDEFVAGNQGQAPNSVTVGFFGSAPTLLPITVPLILSATWGLPSFRIKDHQILQRNMIGDASYYRGFHRYAKQRRVLAALSGSAIGIVSGMISYYIFTPN